MFWAIAVAIATVLVVPLLIFGFVMLVDWLEPLRRVCPACHRRGVTEGRGQPFVAEYEYDHWRFCRSCRMFFTGVDGAYRPLGQFKWPISN